ncbi:MAG: hypothetical protein GY719_24325 [bacterium]|nr:hypothetical protein [bacterium]
MAHILEIPDPLFAALETVAETSGKTPVEWIAEQLARRRADAQDEVSRPAEAKTLANLMEGRLGRVHSGGDQRLSETCGEKLTDHLVAKRRAGHL